VLAGPADERSMAFCDDPAHAWVRDTFDREPTDPRCPVTNAYGRLDGVQMGERPPEDRST
jgi:5-deoxy-glucuronate isomerase